MRSRYKEVDSRSEVAYTKVINDREGVVSTTTYTSLSGELTAKTTKDVVTPNWRARIAAGEIINNPFTSVTTTTQTGEILVSRSYVDTNDEGVYTRNDNGVTSFQEFLNSQGFSLPPVPECTPPIDQAVTQAFANVSNSEALMLVTMAESKKTVRSLVQILLRAVKIFKQVKRLDWHSLRSELSSKQLSDRYLEYRYAIRPLMYDAKSLIAAYTSAAKARRQTFRGYSSSSTNRSDFTRSVVKYDGWHQGDRTFSISGYTETQSSVHAGVLTNIEHISKADTYGLYDIPESLLELTPWSFIINWFVNLADTVASWTPEAGVKILTSWATEKSVARRVIYRWGRSYENNNPDLVSCNSEYALSPYIITCVKTARIINPQRKIIPRVKINLDTFKLLDLILILKKLR